MMQGGAPRMVQYNAGGVPALRGRENQRWRRVQYKVERKPGEEGSVTNSLSILTAIPEVDLGMECVSSLILQTS
jgi:hypothetical protein